MQNAECKMKNTEGGPTSPQQPFKKRPGEGTGPTTDACFAREMQAACPHAAELEPFFNGLAILPSRRGTQT
jgi:hypothetical protein